MYQGTPLSKYLSKRIQYVNRRVKPSPQPLVTAPRLLKLVDLVLKYGQNGCGRVTRLELAGERMSGKILFGLYFICLESFFKNDIEIGRGRILRARGGRLIHVGEMVMMLVKGAKKRW